PKIISRRSPGGQKTSPVLYAPVLDRFIAERQNFETLEYAAGAWMALPGLALSRSQEVEPGALHVSPCSARQSPSC
ncbi:MAG: hypothetical protein OXP75_12725, partial [Rhodospirillales bacterium]|nr:hypothetical protein [Rhodospirillales bacterium]